MLYHKNPTRKDCVANVGIPTVGRIPSHKNKHLIGLSSLSIRQSFSGRERSDYEHYKTCLKWVPTGRTFKLIGLSWIPMRFTKNSNVNCVTTTVRDSNNTNSYQNKHYLLVGGVFWFMCRFSFRDSFRDTQSLAT